MFLNVLIYLVRESALYFNANLEVRHFSYCALIIGFLSNRLVPLTA